MPIPINLVFEDELSEFVLSKLLSCFGQKFYTGYSYNGRGFGYIKKNIHGFNQAAITTPFLILTDLDNHECPITLKNEWIKHPINPNLIFRVAVREVEAWLLADIEGFSSYIGVSEANFPLEPEIEADPKQTLINLVRRSRKRAIREDIVPINANAQIGPNYNQRLMEFVLNHWNLNNAIQRSDSLGRAYTCLDNFSYQRLNSA